MTNSSPVTLSQLNGRIQTALNTTVGNTSWWVVADVTEHSFKEASNYHYFELVEKDTATNRIVAKIRGAAFGSASGKISTFEQVTGQKFTNNIHILAKVRVTFHSVFGLSLTLEDVDPHFTLGVIERKRQETLSRLSTDYPDFIRKDGEGYRTKNASLELPPVISRIAVISSATSAGNEDFRHTLSHNNYGYYFRIDDYFTAVQNEENAALFVSKLIEVYKSGIAYDAVVINRGGGSQTDFLIFDHFKIGLAVAKFPIPVITGIGHHKNETIADLMAHTSTKTPTQAAEFIIAHNKAFEDEVVRLQKQIIMKSQSFLAKSHRSFNSLHHRVLNRTRTVLEQKKRVLASEENRFISASKNEINSAEMVLNRNRYRLETLPNSLMNAERKLLLSFAAHLSVMSKHLVSVNRASLKNTVAVLKIISPENILKKGFALVKKNNEITSDPGQFAPGTEIEIILRSHSIKATVTNNTEYYGNDFNLPESL